MEKNHSYIEAIFNKSRFDINLEDIKNFFSSNQEESSILEFKSGEVEIIDLYKEITAFLNTEGGLLIIGAPRENSITIANNKVKVCQGDLTYSKFKSKDWLYQKICSNIVPSPTNLKIEEFLCEDGNVFLIDIPQSMYPPHQCSSDGKYYIRLERDAKPAPHGIIQALFDKRRVPKLDANINIVENSIGSDRITVTIRNESKIPAEKVSFLVDIYNINKLHSKHNFIFFEDSLGDKFSLSDSSSQVLVQIIGLPINFTVEHNLNEYLIFIGFWCRDLDFEFKYFTYSPKTKKIIEGKLDEGPTLIEELNRIKEIKN